MQKLTPEALKLLRSNLGITTREMARQLGGKTDAGTISRWENGQSEISPLAYGALCHAYGVIAVDLAILQTQPQKGGKK